MRKLYDTSEDDLHIHGKKYGGTAQERHGLKIPPQNFLLFYSKWCMILWEIVKIVQGTTWTMKRRIRSQLFKWIKDEG